MNDPVPSWRSNQFAVTAASFLGFMSFTLVMPFLPLYFRELGVTDVGEIARWSGLSLGVTPAISALLAPVWGRLGDRFGLKIMVERSLLSFVLVMAATGFVTEAWHVLALRAVHGLFAGYGALALTMAAKSAPRNRVASAIGIVQTAQRLGPAIGPVIGGIIAGLVGLRRAFLVAAAFYGVAFLLVVVMYRESKSDARVPAHASGRVTFRNILAFENFVLLLALVFGIQFIDRSLGPILPLFVAQVGASLDRVPLLSGIVFSLAAGSAALGHHLAGRLLQRLPARTVIMGAAITGAGAAAVFAGAPSVAWLMAATPPFGIAMGVAMTTAYTAASVVVPASAHATAFGILTSASMVGLALSPVISGFLAASSIRTVFFLDSLGLLFLAGLVSRVMVGRAAKTEAPVVLE
ncbi:MAG: MFS transporter [Acidobacteria bacterium]|nr:MFS transporter [Acidobacteriota bacterium]